MNNRYRLIAGVIVTIVTIFSVMGLASCDSVTGGVGSSPSPVNPISRNLEIPWSLDFLPDGSIIFTECPGRIRLIDAEGNLRPEPLLEIREVVHSGEGGLLGITLHPNFSENGFLYVYYTYQSGGLANRVVRYRKEGLELKDRTVIIENIPASSVHDGGRIKFGPDGFLYITTGDASVSNLAQDRNSLAGKILRLKDDGTIPADNPFLNSPVYSWGHRNPEGLAWDEEGKLWATEHGSSAMDEINLIQPGANYGWPVIRGDETAEGMRTPVLHSGNSTWAPSGATFFEGSLFFAGLRSGSLWEVKMDGNSLNLLRHLEGQFGRLRAVVVGPDKLFYITTSNRDGRGAPATEDDRIIRLDPKALK